MTQRIYLIFDFIGMFYTFTIYDWSVWLWLDISL